MLHQTACIFLRACFHLHVRFITTVSPGTYKNIHHGWSLFTTLSLALLHSPSTDNLLEHSKLEHIILESDAPYLSSSSGHLTGHPSQCFRVAKKISSVKRISLTTVIDITTQNCKAFYRPYLASLIKTLYQHQQQIMTSYF